MYFFLINFFLKAMERPGLSLYHLNLLHLQMDIVLFGFAFFFFKEKRDKFDHFVPLTHVKIEKGFVINVHKLSGFFSIRYLKTFLQPTFGHVIEDL